MDRRETIDVLCNLYRELGNRPVSPEVINHLVDRIQEQFEIFKTAGGSDDIQQLRDLMQAHADAEEKLVQHLINLNQELCQARERRAVLKKYLGNT